MADNDFKEQLDQHILAAMRQPGMWYWVALAVFFLLLFGGNDRLGSTRS